MLSYLRLKTAQHNKKLEGKLNVNYLNANFSLI